MSTVVLVEGVNERKVLLTRSDCGHGGLLYWEASSSFLICGVGFREISGVIWGAGGSKWSSQGWQSAAELNQLPLGDIKVGETPSHQYSSSRTSCSPVSWLPFQHCHYTLAPDCSLHYRGSLCSRSLSAVVVALGGKCSNTDNGEECVRVHNCV